MERHSNLPLADQQHALENEPGFRDLPAPTQQRMRDRLIQHKLYIEKHGDDMPDIRDWTWPY